MTYKKTHCLIFSILLSQVIFALAAKPLLNKDNVFPFHRWALFSHVNRGYSFPIIYILQADNEKFSPPISYYDFFKNRKYVDFLVGMDNLQLWLNLTLKEQSAQALTIQKSLEKHLFRYFKNVTYEIRYDLIDQVRFMRKREVETIGPLWGPFEFSASSE